MSKQPEQVKATDRRLSPVDVSGTVFGVMAGRGLFAMPGNTFLNGTALFCIIRMLLGGVGARSVAAKTIDISMPAKTLRAVLKQ